MQDKKAFMQFIVWQKVCALDLECYKVTGGFLKEETYGLASQLQRATVFIQANIAEGYERSHRKEYQQFLIMAKGSLGKLEGRNIMFAKRVYQVVGLTL